LVDITSPVPSSTPTLLADQVRRSTAHTARSLRVERRWLAGIQFLIELSLIVVISLNAARGTLVMDPDLQIRGGELSYLIYPGAYAGEIFRRSGSIPLWNTLLGSGEPLIEHAFSFVLNPFMLAPFLVEPSMVQASKYALIIHIVLMGLGGWLLAYVLRLRAPARVLLGMLCASLGSFVGAIGGGFFQMSLSQVYVIYTFAGLLATLYRRERWGVGLFAVGGMLLLFAGIYWYVLPTFLVGTLMLVCAVVGRWLTWNHESSSIDRRQIERFALAALLLAGLGAIRALPEVTHFSIGIHPGETFVRFNSFSETIQRYFFTFHSNDLMRYPQAFHYAFPGNLFFGLLALRVLTLLHPAVPRWRWRVWVPAVAAIWIFAMWAQVDNQFIHALYDLIPALHAWRLIERMQAAGALWVAVLGAVMVDDLWRIARWYLRRMGSSTRVRRRMRRIVRTALAAALIAVILYVGADMSTNWDRVSGVEATGDLEGQALAVIRAENPHGMVSVYTSDFFSYFSFPRFLARGWTGNPDYRPRIEPTVGNLVPNLNARFEPEFAIASGYQFWNTALLQQYADYPPALGYARYKPNAVPYAFAMALTSIQMHTNAYELPTREWARAMEYEHHVDSVIVFANGVLEETLIGAQETAYPGWQVTVNGQPRQLESLYGYVGVRVYPKDGEGLQVVFSYQPRVLYAGAMITIVSAVATGIYLLRLEHWFSPLLRRAGISPQQARFWRRQKAPSTRTVVAVQPNLPAPSGQKSSSSGKSGNAARVQVAARASVAESRMANPVKRMEIGLQKVTIEVPPSATPQTIELIPNRSLSVGVLTAAATATALAAFALCLLLIRGASTRTTPPSE
jgi:hypothetical protein